MRNGALPFLQQTLALKFLQGSKLASFPAFAMHPPHCSPGCSPWHCNELSEVYGCMGCRRSHQASVQSGGLPVQSCAPPALWCSCAGLPAGGVLVFMLVANKPVARLLHARSAPVGRASATAQPSGAMATPALDRRLAVP